MTFGNNLSKKVLDHVFGNTPYSAPANIYVALSTTDPGDDGSTITEPSGDGYARVETDAADWSTATDANPSALNNSAAISFPTVTSSGDWGLCTHFALFDHLTNSATTNFLAGNILSGGSKQPTDGDTPRFNIGDLDVTLT